MSTSDTLPGSVGGGTYPPVGSADSSGPGFLQRLGWLFSSPGKALQPPRSSSLWVIPLVVTGLMIASEAVLLRDLGIAQVKTRIAQNEKLSDAQREQILQNMDSGQTGGAGSQAGRALIGAVFGILIGFGLPALLYLLGFNFVLGAKVPFRDIWTVVLFTALITVPREILRVPLMLSKGTLHVYTSPAAFVPPDDRVAVQVLNTFDIFDLYRLVALTLGFAVVASLPVRKAAYPVAIVFVLYFLVGLGCRLSPLGSFMP